MSLSHGQYHCCQHKESRHQQPWYWLDSPQTLQWRQNEHNGISNHQSLLDCSLNHLFRCRSKKTSKLRVTGLCEGKSPVTGDFPAQRASSAENVPIWWRHHEIFLPKHLFSTKLTIWMMSLLQLSLKGYTYHFITFSKSFPLMWKLDFSTSSNELQCPGPVFCLLLRVSSDYAQPVTGQVTEVTCPVTGQAQPELTLSTRQKTGPESHERVPAPRQNSQPFCQETYPIASHSNCYCLLLLTLTSWFSPSAVPVAAVVAARYEPPNRLKNTQKVTKFFGQTYSSHKFHDVCISKTYWPNYE